MGGDEAKISSDDAGGCGSHAEDSRGGDQLKLRHPPGRRRARGTLQDLPASGKYRPVQALSRGLQLLTELNRLGRAKPSEISKRTGIDRTTVYRLLHTLVEEGLVVRDSDEHYRLTLRVRQLSEGFTDTDWTAQIVGHELARLLAAIRWPSDFATFEAGALIVRESSHRYSPYSIHRSVIGCARPVLASAMGRAMLAAVTPAERELMLELIIRTKQPDAVEARRSSAVAAMIAQTLENGYASQQGEVESRFSAIALPVRGPLQVFGALSVIFFRSAMTVKEAAARYLGPLRESVAAIETKIAQDHLSGPQERVRPRQTSSAPQSTGMESKRDRPTAVTVPTAAAQTSQT